MIHKHKWVEVDTQRFDALIEKGNYEEVHGTYLIGQLTKRGVITVMKCEKCGKIKHIRTEL